MFLSDGGDTVRDIGALARDWLHITVRLCHGAVRKGLVTELAAANKKPAQTDGGEPDERIDAADVA